MAGADAVKFPDTQERVPTILIVDDEPLIRVALSDFLQECGFKVLEAANAAEAVAIIERDPAKIDLVFSDVSMPGEFDGLGLAKWVRENHRGTPLFLATGDFGKVNVARTLWAGEPFFAKPYNLDFVAAKIRETIAARKRESR
jgi:CheY-like chemotaxis protein